MSHTADTGGAEALDDRPEWARGYDEPVVVAKGRGDVAAHDPDLAADEPLPDCNEAGRQGGVDWRVREFSATDGRRCRQCSGEIDHADQQAKKTCEACGEEVYRTKFPMHLAGGCDGS